jgi:RNA polymerase sigma-70 factor (ECF subfamily)
MFETETMLFICLSIIDDPADEIKFNEVYKLHNGFMLRFMLSRLKNKQDAEDALQNALLKLVKNISKIDDVSAKKTRSFLVTLCRSVAIDFYRANEDNNNKMDIGEENDMDSIASTITLDSFSGLMSKDGYKRP